MSVVQILNVKLQRADQSVSWGFNIQGGIDQNMPIMIIKVNPQSLADRCAMRAGDYIIKIGNTSTEFLSSHDCRETIIKQGNDLSLTLFRGAIPKHDDYLASFQFPQPQLMNAHVPTPMPSLSPQVGVQLATNKALLTQSYNSPVGLYSSKNIADTMTAAIKSLAKDSTESSSETGRDNLYSDERYDSASLKTITSLSSSSSSTSVSPTTVQNLITTASSRLYDGNLSMQEAARSNSPLPISSMNSFNPIQKPFYKSQTVQEAKFRSASPLVIKKTAEIITSSDEASKTNSGTMTTTLSLTAKLKRLDFKILDENLGDQINIKPAAPQLSNVSAQVNEKLQNLDFKILDNPQIQEQPPSVGSAQEVKIGAAPDVNYDDIDRETEETFRKYRQTEAAFKRESFSQIETFSIDKYNKGTQVTEPSPLEKILDERRQTELISQELAVRLNQPTTNSLRSVINGRLAKSKSIAVDNQSYYDLHNYHKQSSMLLQPTIQDSYLSKSNNHSKNNYSVNKTVTPTYKPFGNQYPTPSYLNNETAKSIETNKPSTGRTYVGKLDDLRRSSMAQSRTFELLRKTLDSETQEAELVTFNNITNKNEIRRCSLNTNINNLSGKSNPLAPTNIKKPSIDAKPDDDVDNANELRDQFIMSKYAQSRSASIATSSPSSIKDFADSKVNKNTPYYHHFKQFAKEVEQADNDDNKNTLDHLDALKKLMEKRRNTVNSRSHSLNDSNVMPYSSRKYSAQIMPVAGIQEDDENSDS